MTVSGDVFSEMPTIPEFYKGKTVLITGGTGFVGKLLVEKLLYSCPDVKRIYLVIRHKKEVCPEKRLAEIYKNSCFERLRRERSGLFQSKVKAVSGNLLDPNLGLSEEDRVLVTTTTDILIHSAASVRFDDSLKYAFDVNVVATLQLLELAKKMSNLKCYVHISTSFCNIKLGAAIEEKIYPPRADWRTIREICDNGDFHTINTLTPKLLGEYPNTYVFTKHLAEQAVSEHRGELPIIIVRPSVVTGCLEEPAPGWVDNFNGPMGICVAGAQGVLRSVYGDPKSSQDYVPGDVAIKGILMASWLRGTKPLQAHDDIPVYHACAGAEHLISMEYIRDVGLEAAPIIAFENTFRPMNVVFFNSLLLFRLYVLMSHVLPAVAADVVFRVLGKKPMLLRLQRRVIGANLALEFFMKQSLIFNNDKFMELLTKLDPQDRKQFSFTLDGLKSTEYVVNGGLRARKDLLHQDEKTLKKWRTIYKWEVIVDRVITLTLYACALWWILRRAVTSYAM
ncbi:fatty acyl-CoA reductase 1-like [Aricia agestis]|uniref:fatty acyl-CoA reductase 1-like n=1 Tax=Aricia agestis TaxID=91739 RepID=UPI001C20A1AA|nr:fatty acyl-CoA reductase 1-like [Aricia agestis]